MYKVKPTVEDYRELIAYHLKQAHDAARGLKDNYEPDPSTETAIRLKVIIEALEEAANHNDMMHGKWTRKEARNEL